MGKSLFGGMKREALCAKHSGGLLQCQLDIHLVAASLRTEDPNLLTHILMIGKRAFRVVLDRQSQNQIPSLVRRQPQIGQGLIILVAIDDDTSREPSPLELKEE
jgi:hypothetical protein